MPTTLHLSPGSLLGPFVLVLRLRADLQPQPHAALDSLPAASVSIFTKGFRQSTTRKRTTDGGILPAIVLRRRAVSLTAQTQSPESIFCGNSHLQRSILHLQLCSPGLGCRQLSSYVRNLLLHLLHQVLQDLRPPFRFAHGLNLRYIQRPGCSCSASFGQTSNDGIDLSALLTKRPSQPCLMESKRTKRKRLARRYARTVPLCGGDGDLVGLPTPWLGRSVGLPSGVPAPWANSWDDWSEADNAP